MSAHSSPTILYSLQVQIILRGIAALIIRIIHFRGNVRFWSCTITRCLRKIDAIT